MKLIGWAIALAAAGLTPAAAQETAPAVTAAPQQAAPQPGPGQDLRAEGAAVVDHDVVAEAATIEQFPGGQTSGAMEILVNYLRDGEAVGYVRSASYGWTLGGAVGLAMVAGGDEPVTPEWLAAGSWQVDIAGVLHPVEVSLRPMYDPTSARVRA